MNQDKRSQILDKARSLCEKHGGNIRVIDLPINSGEYCLNIEIPKAIWDGDGIRSFISTLEVIDGLSDVHFILAEK